MARFDEKEFRLGDYWLSQQSRSPAWCRTWYDSEKRQTRRASLATTDFEEAKAALTEWFVLNHRKEQEKPAEADLATVLLRYWEDHARNVASAPSIRAHLAHWTGFFRESSVAEATSFQAINDLKKHLRKRGLSTSGVNHVLASGKAAFQLAWKRGELAFVPPIEKDKVGEQEPMGRPLNVDECRRLLVEADRPASAHLHRLILLGLGTAARPGALLELTLSQMDIERRLIHLNPPGREQNKKYRPTVKMPARIAAMLAEDAARPADASVIHYRGQPVQKVKTAWRKLRARCDLDDEVNTYSFRHTIARHLRAEGVPAWEVAAQLGHKIAGTTDRYAPFSPDYLRNAIEAIDGFLDEVAQPRR